MLTSSVSKRIKIMLYYNAENTRAFTEAIKDEASKLGVDLVRHGLDRVHDYNTSEFRDPEHLVDVIVKDMRSWFSGDNLSVKEMDVSIHNAPWLGEFVSVYTRCKR
jgi:hypothetical protein